MMDAFELHEEHNKLYDEYRQEISERESYERENGCTCGGLNATMTNAGTTGMSMDWERVNWDQYCPLHGAT